MAQLINEAKRMQFLAGLITESQLNEEMDIKTLDVASYLAAMDSTDSKNQSLIQSVKQVIDADLSKRSIVINKLKDYAKSNKSDNEIQNKVKHKSGVTEWLTVQYLILPMKAKYIFKKVIEE